ncbi:MAG: copper resistance CopC family protein [Thermodesulfovibrionales bacterium]|jgi:methionine-rich copper-binding protein CopC
MASQGVTMAKGAARFSRVLSQVIIALVVLEAGSNHASAHAVVVDSSPKDTEVLTRAPKEVVLRFNAKIEKSLARFSLTAGEGRIIPIPTPTKQRSGEAFDRLVIPMPAIGPGEYLLRYRVFSIDGHATTGVLRFRILSGP